MLLTSGSDGWWTLSSKCGCSIAMANLAADLVATS
jgi:hypothetical protein